MTKKFIHTSKEVNGAKCKSEFIIPDIFNANPKMIGLETGNTYKSGKIVYTGVNLSVNEVLQKTEKQKTLGFLKKRRAKKIIKNYLCQIKNTEIGAVVTLTNDYKLLKI